MTPFPIRSILVASDLSPNSDVVLRAGATLAARVGAELHVMHAWDLQPVHYGDAAPGTFDGNLAAADAALAAQIERAAPAGTRIASRKVVIFVPHRAIVEHAAHVRADLIVVGRHRATGGGGAAAFLGSTADKVVRSAPVSCLVVYEPLHLPVRTVIAPVDFSEPSRAALRQAVAWTAALHAADEPACLSVLHVANRPPEGDERLAETLRAELGRDIRRAGEEAASADITCTIELRWAREAADEIVRYTEEIEGDLLIMGTHGYGALRRALIGSVASAVTRRAPCPILLVPPSIWRAREEPRSPMLARI
ncbi:MAG TPA: universal stress protein [Longimicrobiales bacterium]|nr:universal stress protein [Longimicrobiales bacterium]